MKVLCFTPLPYGDGSGWWGRDLALTVLGFRELGCDARLVCYSTTHSRDPEGRPVLLIGAEEARSPTWWRNQKPDLVILGLWTRPKYDPIRRAALSVTDRVIERADSDGIRTASCGLRNYIRLRRDHFRDRFAHWPSLCLIFASLLYPLACVAVTPWIQSRLKQTLRLLPALTIETPQGAAHWKSLATRLGTDPGRIYFIPHPIQTDIFLTNPLVLKKNQIISVGRWEAYQKNFPFLQKTLISFLEEHPAWCSLVVGSGLPEAKPHSRMVFSPPFPPRSWPARCRNREFSFYPPDTKASDWQPLKLSAVDVYRLVQLTLNLCGFSNLTCPLPSMESTSTTWHHGFPKSWGLRAPKVGQPVI